VAAFVGGDWPPNHEALAHLVERVLPPLVRDGFTLLAVGAVARAWAGRGVAGLVARGETPNLASVLAAADCGLNPVTRGGGSNVKLPTYLAMGLAVVSTPFGLRGFAPLAPSVVSAPLEEFAGALNARPRGFTARSEPAPPALAGYAWGALGAGLARTLGARRAGVAPGTAHGTAGPELRTGTPGGAA
jgi:hypothetical protein